MKPASSNTLNREIPHIQSNRNLLEEIQTGSRFRKQRIGFRNKYSKWGRIQQNGVETKYTQESTTRQQTIKIKRLKQKFYQEFIEMLWKQNGKFLVKRSKIKDTLKINHDQRMTGHFLRTKTLATIKRWYFWALMMTGITNRVENCLKICQKTVPCPVKSKVTNKLSLDLLSEDLIAKERQ